MLVEFHLKMVYSVHKNKKAPTYMLKSLLVSLDKLKFDRLSYIGRAKELMQLMKPNCYQIMIDIFGMKDDTAFFEELANTKMTQEKFRDVVFIVSLFPYILEGLERDCKGGMDVRRKLMASLIEQNDITTAKLLVREECPEAERADKIFLINKQFYKYRNAKKSAQLIKEFKLDLATIQAEFEEIEAIILNDCMNFFMN